MNRALTSLTLSALVITALACTQVAALADDRPNILLIVADDLGYADLGAFGSDIDTPNIDALAAAGTRFSRFHTAVMCAPTRAMLLSGNNNHVAGMARQGVTGILGEPYPGYENHLSDRIVPLPRLLRDTGYHTYITGKWHLGLEPEHSPRAAGFERSFTNLRGGGNHWNDTGFSAGGSPYRADGELTEWPEGRYSTDLFTERLIGFIDSNRSDGQPFFAFAAYTSPHWPLQVPEDELDRYAGRYDRGYDWQREENLRRLKAAGVIAADHPLPPRNESLTPWTELSPEQQRIEARKMELYAAMVSNLDHHVGRLVGYLKEHGLYENTLIVFMSDNGAAGEDFYNEPQWGALHEYVRQAYVDDYEAMGRPESFVAYGKGWAEAGSAPFQLYKTFAREGGVTAPMIVAGPGVASGGAVSHAYLTVMDLAPTFLELADAQYPQAEEIQPMRGESISALLAGTADRVHADDYVTVHAHEGRVMLRQGPWKLANVDRPFDEADLELFNLDTDPGETTDLAAEEPGIYRELLELWRSERRALGIVLPQDL